VLEGVSFSKITFSKKSFSTHDVHFCQPPNILLFLNFLEITLPLILNVKLVKFQICYSLHLVFMLTFSVVTLNLKLT
jgi:hypothetical protein